MNRRTLLFVINSETADTVLEEAAEATEKTQGHLSLLLIDPAPALPIYAYGGPPYSGMNIPDNWGEMVDEAQRAQKSRVQKIEQVLAQSGVSADVQSVLCATLDVKRHVARRARVCDEVFIAADFRETPEILREAAHGVLFHSPVGLRLNGSMATDANRIFVAWDSSETASSAVHAALPYLKRAEDVVIGCIDPVMTTAGDGFDPGTDVAAWLSHHGCRVTISQFPSGGNEVGVCIQDRAREFGADLVVLGAYGHARVLEAVFGGTTRTMLEQTELPVLLAH
ncbi:universal stress protein [Roseobacter sp. YSTF-M11]|uniref:Universal stress protein n=1 Tax=Roseobacter insulae TaxID=2859783 RepID=A0A9X1FRK0_9RHOB|nr:universal stress protein [Roseobacter insulae]MBW4706308.1 universal stress protein [Roseobacter insulae]